MSDKRLWLSLLFPLSLACGQVSEEGDMGGGESPGDHRADASDDDNQGPLDDGGSPSSPDATPVDCDGPEDCTNPDDPCLLPGTCENHTCVFPEKDCSGLDSECTRGVCADNGECEARAIREAMACGDGIMHCGGFGACGQFADTCDESGTQSRACADSTCQAGECVTGDPYVDTRSCQRDTDGTTCAASTTSCGTCAYSSTCDRTAPPVSCTRTDHTCGNETCGSATVSLPDLSCDRDTECRSCLTIPGGQPGSCSVNGTCGAQCQ